MLVITEIPALVLADGNAAGTAAVTKPQEGFRHMFLVTMTAAASVWVEAAITPTGLAPLRWVKVSGAIAVTDSIAVAGNFTNLRIAWSGNLGAISVDVIRSAQQPNVY